MKKILALASVLLLGASLSYAQVPNNLTGTTSLSVTVGSEAGIVVASATPFSSSTTFADYTASTALTYYVRTGTSVATAGITLALTTDLSPGGANGGPSVASPPTSDDKLQYTCSASPQPPSGAANPCTPQTVLAVGTSYPVVSFTAGTQSLKTGNAAAVAWVLTNDPNYKAGSYTAGVVTFTISAT